MCKVAYPKFATVYKPSSSLLEFLSHPPTSHLPHPQMHPLTWFFLLWPLATIFCCLGIFNSLILHLGFYKFPNNAIVSTTLLNTHYKSLFLTIYILFIKISTNPGDVFTVNLNLSFSKSFSSVQCIFVCFFLAPVLFSDLQNNSIDNIQFGKLKVLYL